MADLDKFVDIIDRYLEISNVYSERINEIIVGKVAANPAQLERSKRLIGILESVDVHESAQPIIAIDVKQARGQSVTPTPDVLLATKKYQNIVLERFTKGRSNLLAPRNTNRLVNTLRLPANQFLACFKSVSYAWDILVELASISVLPDTESLEARDMIYMHCTELEAHLRSITVLAYLAKPEDTIIDTTWKVSVDDLLRMSDANVLVRHVVEAAIPRQPDLLLRTMCDRMMPEALKCTLDNIADEKDEIAVQLAKKESNFADLLEQGCSMRDAKAIVDRLVSFGLRAGYGVWFSASTNDVTARSSLRKNIVFCTRILLDEGRWLVCRDVAKSAIEIVRLDNLETDAADEYYGTYMLKANWFWCRRKLGENIHREVEAWDTSSIHPRYEFLKMVLLENYDSAMALARTLLLPESDTGVSNMCMEEFIEWPILEFFRSSKEFKTLAHDS
jgi:hypothetical protein